MEFFIPKAGSGDEATVLYEGFAQRVGAQVPGPGERVASIDFVSRGETWRATVGERLQRLDPPGDDPSLVLAIFPGPAWQIVTDGGALDGPPSAFKPFIVAGLPTSVDLFDA